MAAKELEDKEQYIESIKYLVPIDCLPPQLQSEVINIAKIFKYKKRDFVFKQGDRDGYAYYLLDGKIDLLADNHSASTIASGTDSSRYAMARLEPRQFSAKALSESIILQLDRAALDRIMVVMEEEKNKEEEISGEVIVEVSDIGEEDSGDWMTKVLQSDLFCRLPTANIHQLFALLEPVEFNAGDVVINQDATAENFYIIQEGRCEVIRTPSSGAKPVKLAELSAGYCFGEEALLTEAKRNASVVMKTDGVVMRLSKDNFINLIKKPTLNEVTYKEGKKLVSEGAVWLDVRYQDEFESSNIEGSVNVPLNILRMQTENLQKDKKYVVYCDTSGRSSAAAFLLTERGYDVSYLKDGLDSVPDDIMSNRKADGTEKFAEETAQEQVQEAVTEPPRETESADESDLDHDIRSSMLDIDLERTNIDLQDAMERTKDEDGESAKEAREAHEKLLKEKKKLEEEKREAEEAAKKLRDEEARKLDKLKKEAEKRLEDEKKKIEDIYARNTREMEKLQKQKEQAEAQIRKEREKLEKDAEEARKKDQELQDLKRQLEESRAALEAEAERKRKDQDALEKAIQAKAKAKLDAEKRKLAEEFARTNEEMQKAQRAQAMAEAARKAAKDEAQKIIEEYKEQFEEERAKEQARLQEERKKLEAESRKFKETLNKIQQDKKEAELKRLAAEEEAQKLRDKQIQVSKHQDEDTRKVIEDQIKAAEARMQQAQKSLETAQEAEENIEAAKELNEQELQRQKEEEERIRQQVAEDLAVFDEEHKKEEESTKNVVANADHIKRIKERAAAAKKEAENATDNLFADVAAQLGKDD